VNCCEKPKKFIEQTTWAEITHPRRLIAGGLLLFKNTFGMMPEVEQKEALMKESVHITIPLNPAIEKLVVLAGGNPFLVVEAIRFMARQTMRIERYGFLWLKKRSVLHEEADLDRVVWWIQEKLKRQKMA
jgi:hypothetical protein